MYNRTNTIGNILKISFLNNKNIVIPKDLEICKLDNAGCLYLDMNDPKDCKIIDILNTANTIIFDNEERPILDKCFILDGTALFINVGDPIR